MKKALLYVATAILLGTVAMVAPLMLFKPRYFEAITQGSPTSLETLDKGEGMYGDREALERAVSPSNLSSAGLILIPSFLLALGVSLYLKKRMF
jgi:hypothetical protein